MKILFLDIDGVMLPLNYHGTLPMNAGYAEFSKSAIKHLNQILSSSDDIKIVISSAWRRWGLEHMQMLLEQNGIDKSRVVDITGDERGQRGYQIQCWLDRNPGAKSIAILDDNSDMDGLMNRLVKTNPFVGLTQKDADSVIHLLSNK